MTTLELVVVIGALVLYAVLLGTLIWVLNTVRVRRLANRGLRELIARANSTEEDE